METLAYNPTEYEGELYHIQLSCNEDSNDYIFVAWGMTNVTERKHLAVSCVIFIMIITSDIVCIRVLHYILILFTAKFNCTVPGTLYTYTIDCPAPQTTDDKPGPSKGSGDDHTEIMHERADPNSIYSLL